MNKFFKRIGAILLALTLCFSTSLTAFAAAEESNSLLEAQSASSYSFDPIYITLDTSRTVTFVTGVTGDGSENALYYLTITRLDDGYCIFAGTRAGNTPADTITMYAQAGTYKFSYIYQAGTPSSRATAVAKILY